MLSTLQQRDGYNCGVLCIVQVSCYINETVYVEQQGSRRVRFRDQALRLRMLWELLCLSSEKKLLLVKIQLRVSKVQEITEKLHTCFD